MKRFCGRSQFLNRDAELQQLYIHYLFEKNAESASNSDAPV